MKSSYRKPSFDSLSPPASKPGKPEELWPDAGMPDGAWGGETGKPDTPIYLCNRIREKGKEVSALEKVTIYQSSLASNN